MLRQRTTGSLPVVEDHGSKSKCDVINGKRNSANKITFRRPLRLVIWSKLKFLLGVSFCFFIFIAVICPVVFKNSISIRRSLLFMNWLNVPLFRNLSNPEGDYGLNCTRNFYIKTNEDLSLGMWHVLPNSRVKDCDFSNPDRIDAKSEFADNHPVIYYLHGNGGARGGPHRKELYKLLAYHELLNYHIVAIDYRGYGDSSNVQPTVDGLAADAAAGYFWLLDQIGGDSRRVTVWGHSLGTGIATYFMSNLQDRDQPNGLLLESPFSSIADAIRGHPFTVVFNWLPYFDYFFVDPIVDNKEHNFDTVSKIGLVNSPLLVLHAVDDGIVPYSLGVKLYRAALERRPKSLPPAKMITFDASHGYGHKNIYLDKEIPKIVKDFVES